MKKVTMADVRDILLKKLGVESPSKKCAGDLGTWLERVYPNRKCNCSDCGRIGCSHYMEFDQSKICEGWFPQ